MSDSPNPRERVNVFSDDMALLDQLLAEEGVATASTSAMLHAQPRPEHVPLSFGQELLWRLDRVTPGLTAYNLPVVRRLHGPLDVAALRDALTQLAARHEVLRTRFVAVDGEPVQVVDPPASVEVTVSDVGSEQEASRIAAERALAPFDLGHEHMFRPRLLRIAADDHVLLIETHHMTFDGWSQQVLFRDLGTLYSAQVAGSRAELPVLPIQYADYAVWQRETLVGGRLATLVAYWRRELADSLDPLELPTDFPRTGSPTFDGGHRAVLLPADLVMQLRESAQVRGATLYMMVLAGLMTVLHRYTGARNVLVGSGIAAREEIETEPLIGYFNNTVVQRGDLSGDPTFSELLARVRESAFGAYEHHEIPLEKLVLELREGRERLSDAPLFNVVCTMQDTLAAAIPLVGLTVEPFGVEIRSTKFDLTLLPSERDDGLLLNLVYRSDLFTGATADRILGHLSRVLTEVVADPDRHISRLPILTDGEVGELHGWNATRVDEGPPATVNDLFTAVAARFPSAAAGVVDSETITYEDLETRANQLAWHLSGLGVGPDVAVGLCLDRTIDMLVGLLGILKAGGAYVPLLPDHPAARIAHQVAASGVRIAVTRGDLAERLPSATTLVSLDRDAATLASLSPSAPPHGATPESLAYVLFTSGSTGVPKGVAVTHANVVHYARAVSRVLAEVPRGHPGDGLGEFSHWHIGMASTIAADLGNTSLYTALLSGGTLHLLPIAVTTEPERFREYVAQHQLDMLKITPNHLRALIAGRTGSELSTLLPRRWLVCGGEALSFDLADELLALGRCRVLNHYGPTETTVGACASEVTAATLDRARAAGAGTVPLGYPLANTQCHVLDINGEQVPVSVPGELVISGAGVVRGYLGRPDLTEERFVHLPGIGRAYRTGDRVRRLADGALEFLGRLDSQVKVRGYRVELGEIEGVLSTYPGVMQAVATLSPGDGEPGLTAHVQLRTAGYGAARGELPTPERLQQWARERLPDYMVPSSIGILDQFPLTANGKIDRAALPDLLRASEAGSAKTVEPRTPTEEGIAAIWASVLKRDRVGVTDDFVALGGHSLLAIRILGTVSRRYGVRLPLRTLFEAPTVAQFAELVDLTLRITALEAMSVDDAARLLGPGAGSAEETS